MKKWPQTVLYLLLAIALLRDLLANECPIFCKIGDTAHFPAFRTLLESPDRVRWPKPLDSIYSWNLWQAYPYQSVVFAPIAFSPGKSNAGAASRPPLSVQDFGTRSFRHWLGTDPSGRDVAAGLVAGARVALWAALLVLGLAGLAGVLLGGLGGYFGDDRLRVSWARLWANGLALPVALFYAFVPRWYFLTNGTNGGAEWRQSLLIFGAIFLVFNALAWAMERRGVFSKKITLPADLAVMRLAELFRAVPLLLLIVAVAAASASGLPSVTLVLAIVGVFSWPGVAVMLRGELLRIRELDYIQSARALGYSDWRIILRHALPNALRPLLVGAALGVATAVSIEATLSFLGFTSDALGASWGGVLHEARGSMSLWWLAIFPGLAICLTVLALHALADDISRK